MNSTEMANKFCKSCILLSRTQAGPGRTVKQEQEEISHNHVQTFISFSLYCKSDPNADKGGNILQTSYVHGPLT